MAPVSAASLSYLLPPVALVGEEVGEQEVVSRQRQMGGERPLMGMRGAQVTRVSMSGEEGKEGGNWTYSTWCKSICISGV